MPWYLEYPRSTTGWPEASESETGKPLILLASKIMDVTHPRNGIESMSREERSKLDKLLISVRHQNEKERGRFIEP
jgi:hypothetical protein